VARIGVGATTKTKTVNKAGGQAYTLISPAVSLVHAIGHFMNEPKYYPDGEESPTDIDSEGQNVIALATQLAKDGRHEELLSIARWARTDLNLRTTPIVVLATACEYPGTIMVQGRNIVATYAPTIMQRADEPRNLFAAWRHLFGAATDKGLRTRRVPSVLRRSVARILSALPEHALAKWAGNVSPTLGDVIRVADRGLVKQAKLLYFVNPEKWAERRAETPVLDARDQLFKREKFDATSRELAEKARLTWENLVTHFGKGKEIWEFAQGQMGYMALLRNLRNLEQAGVNLEPVAKRIADEEEVAKARQLPFRYMSAIEAVTSPILHKALSKAMDLSLKNVPELKGKTTLLVDVSGSMTGTNVSSKSVRTCADAAAALAGMFYSRGTDVSMIVFSQNARKVTVKGNGAMAAAEALKGAFIGGGTNPAAGLPLLLKDTDRVILLSDMQCYSNEYGASTFAVQWNQWKKNNNEKAWMHSVNLVGTIESQLDQSTQRINLMSGFSEQLMSLIASVEANESPTKAATITVEEIVKKFRIA